MIPTSYIELAQDTAWAADPLSHADILLDAAAYDADLGMHNARAICRQLEIDVPRCTVHIDGLPVRCPRSVHRHSPYPRMSTQAVFAPVIEWFLRHNIIAQEHPTQRELRIVIDTREGTETLCKHFCLRTWTGQILTHTCVTIHINARAGAVIVSNRTMPPSRDTVAPAPRTLALAPTTLVTRGCVINSKEEPAVPSPPYRPRRRRSLPPPSTSTAASETHPKSCSFDPQSRRNASRA